MSALQQCRGDLLYWFPVKGSAEQISSNVQLIDLGTCHGQACSAYMVDSRMVLSMLPTGSNSAAAKDEAVSAISGFKSLWQSSPGASVSALRVMDADFVIPTIPAPSVGGSADISAAWPVGSIFLSTVSTNPGTILGFGTWTSFGAGRVLVGLDSGDTDFDTVLKTGGSKTVASTGSVSTATFTGTQNQVTTSVSAGTPAGTVSQPTLTMNAYTPAGTVSAPSFMGDTVNTTGVSGGTPAGSVAKPTLTMDSYTPTGNVSKPTFTGDTVNTTGVGAGTPSGTLNAPVFTGDTVVTNNVSAGTPTGNVSKPVLTMDALGTHNHELPIQIVSNTVVRFLASSVYGTGTSQAAAGNVTTTANVTNAAVALSQSKSAGTPTGNSNTPVFTGTALGTHQHNVALTGNISIPVFNGAALAVHNHNVLTTGNISTPSYTGTANTLTGNVSTPAFTGNALSVHNHNVALTGNISTPAFSGTANTLTGSVSQQSFTGNSLIAHNHVLTPAGTIGSQSFTGDATSVLQPYLTVFMFKRVS